MTTHSRSMSSGHGLRTARLRVMASTVWVFAAAACGKLILARGGDEFFELQFQLLDQPGRALGALPVQFALELLDPQLKMRDQSLVVRQIRPGVGGIRDGHIAFSLQRLTLGQQRRVGTCEVRRKSAPASMS